MIHPSDLSVPPFVPCALVYQKPGEGDMDEHTRILPPLQVEAQSACCVALDTQVNPEESLVIKARGQ